MQAARPASDHCWLQPAYWTENASQLCSSLTPSDPACLATLAALLEAAPWHELVEETAEAWKVS